MKTSLVLGGACIIFESGMKGRQEINKLLMLEIEVRHQLAFI